MRFKNQSGSLPIIGIIILLVFLAIGIGYIQSRPSGFVRNDSLQTAKKRLEVGTFQPITPPSFEADTLIVKFTNPLSVSALGQGSSSSRPIALDDVTGGLSDSARQKLRLAHVLSLQLLFDTTYRLSLDHGSDVKEAAEVIKTDPSVVYAEPNYHLSFAKVPNDQYYSQQWEWRVIQAPEAWDTSVGSNAITVAVIDTGVAPGGHPDLNANLLPGRNMHDPSLPVTDTCKGGSFGHGTHTAGTIGAVGNNGTGVTGMNWQVKLLPLNVEQDIVGNDPTGSGCDVPDDVMARAVRYAADNGVRVMNISIGGFFGGLGASPQVVKEAIDYALSRNVVVVAAAGNNNVDVAQFYPASFDGVIAVAASTPQDTKASFSNWGNRIDVSAPGTEILSTFPNGYRVWEGTSMAAPHVTGLAALILSVNPNLTQVQVRDIIRSSADDLGAPGRDTSFGYGRINARKAIEAANHSAGHDPSPSPTNSPTVSPHASPSPLIPITPTPNPSATPMRTTVPFPSPTSASNNGWTISLDSPGCLDGTAVVGYRATMPYPNSSMVEVYVNGVLKRVDYNIAPTSAPGTLRYIPSQAFVTAKLYDQYTGIFQVQVSFTVAQCQ